MKGTKSKSHHSSTLEFRIDSSLHEEAILQVQTELNSRLDWRQHFQAVGMLAGIKQIKNPDKLLAWANEKPLLLNKYLFLLCCSLMDVYSSLQVNDNLIENVSKFYAELKRISGSKKVNSIFAFLPKNSSIYIFSFPR